MAKKAMGKRAAPARKVKAVKAKPAKAKSVPRKAAKVKGAPKRIEADVKAVLGAIPPWAPAEIEEGFRRFQAANAEPKGELHHVNPFTLLVAVVLSAQATDAGVNRATKVLFERVRTPEEMLALGEATLKDFIKTIGLYNSKAKNIIALSRILAERHGSQVPPSREVLETLPGVGRKTANVVLNVAFGEPTIAVDTHIFRVCNRTGLAPGKTPLEVEQRLERVVPDERKLHAHHWLILHGRYVCKARRPDCFACAVNDLCAFKGKTTLEVPVNKKPAAKKAAKRKTAVKKPAKSKKAAVRKS
jgi:endonuclease-3